MKTETPLYDTIGRGYDTTRRADPAIAGRLRRLLDVRDDGVYLDLGCGTGNYTVALAMAGGRWIGVDLSACMIEVARRKSSTVTWQIASATALPLSTGEVSGVVCVLAVHHFVALADTFREVRRVLRAGGRLVLFTASREQMRGYWLNAYFPRTMARAIEQMPDAGDLEQIMRLAGIAPVHREPFVVEPDIQDLFLYSGKHSPERYLDPQVRAGISTFATLADPAEVATGCERLATDLRTGRFRGSEAECPCSEGDYLFLVGQAS
jgi:ubiquinone/menaquinone biosynthesis C-methylase UbiE